MFSALIVNTTCRCRLWVLSLFLAAFAGHAAAQLDDDVAARSTAPAVTPPATGQFELSVPEVVFGTDVDRERLTVIGPATEFPAATDRIFCLTRIVGAKTETQVTHIWYHEGKTKAKVILRVGSSNWRTYSAKRLLPSWTGHWEVKVLDENGEVLATASFEVI